MRQEKYKKLDLWQRGPDCDIGAVGGDGLLKRDCLGDVGSAEGYYAVGLARRFPSAFIYSYDADTWARWQQRRLASLNRVKNIHVGRFCSNSELTRHIAGRTLLVCDIEGNVYQLLDPVKTPALLNCDFLVEVHVCEKDGFSIRSGKDKLVRRFSSSRRITVLELMQRKASLSHGLVGERLTPVGLADCTDERRGTDQMWISPEAGVGASETPN